MFSAARWSRRHLWRLVRNVLGSGLFWQLVWSAFVVWVGIDLLRMGANAVNNPVGFAIATGLIVSGLFYAISAYSDRTARSLEALKTGWGDAHDLRVKAEAEVREKEELLSELVGAAAGLADAYRVVEDKVRANVDGRPARRQRYLVRMLEWQTIRLQRAQQTARGEEPAQLPPEPVEEPHRPPRRPTDRVPSRQLRRRGGG